MLALKDLMTPAPVTITPGATLRDAVELLTKVGVNALPVIDGGDIVGILTAQSIVALSRPRRACRRSANRRTSGIQRPWRRTFPTPAFFMDMWEDAGSDIDERFRVTDSPEWDFLSEHLVEEAMVSDPPQFSPEASVDEAARRMRVTGAHGVSSSRQGSSAASSRRWTSPEPSSNRRRRILSEMQAQLALRLAIAGLIGLATGPARERSGRASGPDARFAGLRTFLLLGLLGGVAGLMVDAGDLVLAAAIAGRGVGALRCWVCHGGAARSPRQRTGRRKPRRSSSWPSALSPGWVGSGSPRAPAPWPCSR